MKKAMNHLIEDMSERIVSRDGRIGYLIAWILGVPSSILLLIFLIRGH